MVPLCSSTLKSVSQGLLLPKWNQNSQTGGCAVGASSLKTWTARVRGQSKQLMPAGRLRFLPHREIPGWQIPVKPTLSCNCELQIRNARGKKGNGSSTWLCCNPAALIPGDSSSWPSQKQPWGCSKSHLKGLSLLLHPKSCISPAASQITQSELCCTWEVGSEYL